MKNYKHLNVLKIIHTVYTYQTRIKVSGSILIFPIFPLSLFKKCHNLTLVANGFLKVYEFVSNFLKLEYEPHEFRIEIYQID